VGITDPLANPVLELRGTGGFVTIINDDWRETQEAEIQATGIPPTNDLESAILVDLNPGSYTAVLRGTDNGTGVGLVEIFDLSQGATAKLANISTRGFVATGSDVLIGGFIIGGGATGDLIVLRGIGPSLASAGLSPVLPDPRLELHDASGALVMSNDNWQDDPTQAALITALGLAPTNNMESAIAATLAPGAYTTVLAGVNNVTGLGLVEVYDNPVPTGVTPTPTPVGSVTPSPTPGGSVTPTPSPGVTATPTPGGVCMENFDSVTAPALPPG